MLGVCVHRSMIELMYDNTIKDILLPIAEIEAKDNKL
jgi:hypothetical protein